MYVACLTATRHVGEVPVWLDGGGWSNALRSLKELCLGKGEVKRVEGARDLLLAEVHVKFLEIESRGASHDDRAVREVELVIGVDFWGLGAFRVFHRAVLVFELNVLRECDFRNGR